ncbi:MAG: helix-turn-helix domain-containing protein [Verrucomicrobiia bacterium]
MDDVDFPGWRPEKSIEVVEANGLARVLVKGQPYMSWQSGNEGCLRLAIAQLYECGLGTGEQLAQAFGRHVNSVQKYLKDFANEGVQGLMPERRGPKGRWKLTPELRGKILLIVLREGIWKLEAIQQRLMEAWYEAVSVPSIQQVLEENGLGESTIRSVGDPVVQGELFALEPEPQLLLPLGSSVAQPAADSMREGQRGSGNSSPAGAQAEAADLGRGWRRDSYSPAQRVYLDQLEQGAYNAYAGGLLFAPLVARYDFLPTLRRVLTISTHEGYNLEELGLTLFYLDVFGFRSMEDFKRAYPEEFGLLVGRAQSPSLFTLRRFLHKVRKLGKGEVLIEEFALSYLKSGLSAWGVMYIDGHFMPYYVDATSVRGTPAHLSSSLVVGSRGAPGPGHIVSGPGFGQ